MTVHLSTAVAAPSDTARTLESAPALRRTDEQRARKEVRLGDLVIADRGTGNQAFTGGRFQARPPSLWAAKPLLRGFGPPLAPQRPVGFAADTDDK